MKTPSRRVLLAQAGAVAATLQMIPQAAIATPVLSTVQSGHPDAAQIAWCAEFDHLERDWQDRTNAIPDEQWDALVPEMDKWHTRKKGAQTPLVDLICGIPPTTLEGAKAVAVTLTLWNRTSDQMLTDDREAGPDQRLTMTLLSGLIGGAA